MCVQVWYVQIEMRNKYVGWINNVNIVVCSTFNVKWGENTALRSSSADSSGAGWEFSQPH